MHLDLMTFIVASLLSRGARFFILTGIIRIFGDTAKKIIDSGYKNYIPDERLRRFKKEKLRIKQILESEGETHH